jgi:hypothetical protein
MQRGQVVHGTEAHPAAEFWADARADLSGLPGDAGLNIAHEAVDRHAAGPSPTGWRCAACASPGRRAS